MIFISPLLFTLHEAEEYGTMLPWLEKHGSVIPDAVHAIIPAEPDFIAYAGIVFLILFTVAGFLAMRSRPQRIAWIVLAILFTARLANAVLHTIESVVLMQYTPGVLTAVVLVLPLSLYLIRRLLQLGLIRGRWLPGIIVAGIAAQTAGIGAVVLLGSIQ